MSILITHAYSAHNLGDALLVKLTSSLLDEIAPNVPRWLAALDAPSFADQPHLSPLPVLGPAAQPRWQGALNNLATLGHTLLTGRPSPQHPFSRLQPTPKLVVGVGGGYLRTGGPIATTKMLLAHLSQLAWVARAGIPAVYLPQSIGPLHGPVGAWVRHLLWQIPHIFVRDDLSAAELAGHPGLQRLPDLAVLALADLAIPPPAPPTMPPRFFLSARPLSRGSQAGYVARLGQLRAQLSAQLITQSSSRGQNDAAFYARHWPTSGPWPSSDACFAPPASGVVPRNSGVVMSVRLHGSLQAILAGLPAIHLSYERKGYGAYADLGLERWLFAAADFDPTAVAASAKALAADPSHYWAALAARQPWLLAQRQQLRQQLQQIWQQVA